MSSGHRTFTLFVTLILGLLLTILALCLGWPMWTWPVAAALLVTGAAVAGRVTTPPAEAVPQEFRLEPDLPCAEPERREQRISAVALPSAAADYDFLFSGTIRWRPVDVSPDAPAVSAGGLAVRAILERAQLITVRQPPHRSTLTQHELDGVLGTMEMDPTGRVLAMAEDISLALSDGDAVRLRKLSSVRKDTLLWEHERRYECDRRDYLSQDVLKDTGSAVVWWLTKNDDQVKKTVDDIGLLAQLSSAATNQKVPGQFEHMVPFPEPKPAPREWAGAEVPDMDGNTSGPGLSDDAEAESREATPADHFGAMLTSIGFTSDDAQSALLAQQCAHLLATMGYDEAAADIGNRFDAPSPPKPEEAGPGAEDPAGSPDDGGGGAED